jgi:hypothetical protein
MLPPRDELRVNVRMQAAPDGDDHFSSHPGEGHSLIPGLSPGVGLDACGPLRRAANDGAPNNVFLCVLDDSHQSAG